MSFAIDEEFNFFARVVDGDCWTDIYVEGDDPNNPIIDWNEIADGTDYIVLSPVMVDPDDSPAPG
mgnify:FL=1